MDNSDRITLNALVTLLLQQEPGQKQWLVELRDIHSIESGQLLYDTLTRGAPPVNARIALRGEEYFSLADLGHDAAERLCVYFCGKFSPAADIIRPTRNAEICQEWQQYQQCSRGYRCPFAHAVSPSRKDGPHVPSPQRNCLFYNTPGGCKQGASCRFAHVGAQTYPSNQGVDLMQTAPVQLKACRFFGTLAGCKAGANCPYSHGEEVIGPKIADLSIAHSSGGMNPGYFAANQIDPEDYSGSPLPLATGYGAGDDEGYSAVSLPLATGYSPMSRPSSFARPTFVAPQQASPPQDVRSRASTDGLFQSSLFHPDTRHQFRPWNLTEATPETMEKNSAWFCEEFYRLHNDKDPRLFDVYEDNAQIYIDDVGPLGVSAVVDTYRAAIPGGVAEEVITVEFVGGNIDEDARVTLEYTGLKGARRFGQRFTLIFALGHPRIVEDRHSWIRELV